MDGILESGAGRRAERIMAVGVAIGALVGLAMVVALYLTIAPVAAGAAAADRAYWTVSGPPCPTATWTELNRIPRPLAQVSNFGGARFARVSGAVLCEATTTGLGTVINTVCQFNRPRALAVWSKGGVRYFDLASGEPATVTASDHRPPRCVMASNYKGE